MEFVLPNLECVEKPLVYAIVFDTGYFYVGQTRDFKKRIKSHISAIKNNPRFYLINEENEPKICKFIKLISCDDVKKCLKYERDFVLINSGNAKMINAHYGYCEKNRLFKNKIKQAFKSIQ